MDDSELKPTCAGGEHEPARPTRSERELERAARLLRAMADAPRLRILELLQHGELCVTAIVAALGEKFTTVSLRLKLLHTEGLIVRRRDGNHIFYALADRHIVDLMFNALAHAMELDTGGSPGPHERESDHGDASRRPRA